MFSFTFGCSLAYSCTNGSLVESVQTVIAESGTCVASLNADEPADPDEPVVAGVTLAQPARAMATAAAARVARLLRRPSMMCDDLIVIPFLLFRPGHGG
jgi:hypothetical protein